MASAPMKQIIAGLPQFETRSRTRDATSAGGGLEMITMLRVIASDEPKASIAISVDIPPTSAAQITAADTNGL